MVQTSEQELQDRIAVTVVKRDAVKTREVARLVKLATRSGYFDRRSYSKTILAMFKAHVDEQPARQSEFRRLNIEVIKMKDMTASQARRDNTYRKILLGAYLLDHFDREPELLATLRPQIIRFVETQSRPKEVQNNKSLLKLNIEAIKTEDMTATQTRKKSTHRKILLGTFLVGKFDREPEFLATLRPQIIEYVDKKSRPKDVQKHKSLLDKWIGDSNGV